MNCAPIAVLHFTTTEVRSGVEEHILLLLRHLDRKYFRLLLVCPPQLVARYGSDLPTDVELMPICFQKITQLDAARRFAQVLRKQKVDILHSHMFQSSRLASPIGRMCGVALIVETPHVREGWRHGWIKKRYVVDRALSRFVDKYIAVSDANARYLTQHKGLPSEKITVIRNGCDLGRFDPTYEAPQGLRRALGFDKNDAVLVVIGRLEPQKGHRVLLDALAEVRRAFPEIRLVCVGDGSLRSDLEKQVENLCLQNAVRFVGYQSDIRDWLAVADFTVLPSLYEGLPLAAIESLAAGRPVVASAVYGTPEVVINEKTGLTVPPGNVDLLAQAILRMLREPQLRVELAHGGRYWVMGHFSQEQQVQGTQEFYVEAWEQSVRKRERRFSMAEGETGIVLNRLPFIRPATRDFEKR
jgi:glycosyltransferase involved in cell wall biosynthesis